MARSQFPVQVLTPEGQVFEGEVEMISTRTGTGSLGVLAHHAPLMAMLEPTELALYENKDDGLNANREAATRFAQSEGYLQVADNRVLVLVEDAIPPDEMDRSAFESRLKEARDAVVLIAHDVRLQDRGGRVERVDGRVDALLGDRPRQHDEGV